MPVLTDYALCARALTLIGAQPIASFEDGTVEALVAESFYLIVRDALLASHPWNFATEVVDLSRLVDTPESDYAYGFQLPPGVVRILSVGREGYDRGIVYRRRGDVIETDAYEVTLRYIAAPGEEVYPAYFQMALIMALAEAFVLPLTESTSRWVELGRAAERAASKARLIDAQEDTADLLQLDALTAVR